MSKPHRRNQSADDAMSSPVYARKPQTSAPFPFAEGRSDHHPLGEIVPNRDTGNGEVPVQKAGDKKNKGPMHKKTKSAVSLKSLKSYMERKSEDTPSGTSEEKGPKKAKSNNSLSAILKRSQRGRKGENPKKSHDKENRSPSDLLDSMPSPVWAQAPAFQDSVGRSRQDSAADKRRSVAEEVSLYTPRAYNPAQQRNFFDSHQPSLVRPGEPRPRPKSDILTGNWNFKELIPQHRAALRENDALRPDNSSSRVKDAEMTRKISAPESPALAAEADSNTKRLSRVQAAISALNGKGRDVGTPLDLDSKNLESEFEKLLVGQPSIVIFCDSQSNMSLGRPKHPSQYEGQDAVTRHQYQSRFHPERSA